MELITAFIKEKTGNIVTEESVVFDDLQIDGLDSYTFMEDFATDFNVDMTQYNPEDYSFSEYEVGNIFLTIYRAIFNRAKLKRKSFKGAHLIAVAERGYWFDPE